MDLGVLNQGGEVWLHRERHAAPGAFLQALAPSREDGVVGVDGLCTWDWVADLGAREGMPWGLGQA
jgi:hypothetical protein